MHLDCTILMDFRIELTEEYSKEKNIRIDKEEFQRCMEIQNDQELALKE